MRFYLPCLLLLSITALSCETGKLKVIADISNSLKEVSAAETLSGSNLIWTIEDSGNKNNVYGIDSKGGIVKDIDIKGYKNIDWEDLTSDNEGNLYIGDFGNNSRKRKNLVIYKVKNVTSQNKSIAIEAIHFKMPEGIKSEDFEAFFLYNNRFYIFSKNDKKAIVISVPNIPGNAIATFVTEFNLKGKNNRITSADISPDGKTIVLLNHEKLWKLTNFDGDNFFEGTIESMPFEHDSQKEGICFKDNTTVIITDEHSKITGSNIYEFKLN